MTKWVESHRTDCVGFHLSAGDSPLIASSPGGCRIDIQTSPDCITSDTHDAHKLTSSRTGSSRNSANLVDVRMKELSLKPKRRRRVRIILRKRHTSLERDRITKLH